MTPAHTLAACLSVSAALAAGAAAAQPSRYPSYPPAASDSRTTAPSQGYDPYDRSRPNGYAPQRGGYDDRRYDDRAAASPDDNAEEPDLGRELNLRADQRAALDAYKAAFRPDEATARAAEDTARRLPSLSTPQRLDFTRREMERERADFERSDAATRRFYAQLTPEQRRTFDRVTAPQDGEDDGGPTPGDPSARR